MFITRSTERRLEHMTDLPRLLEDLKVLSQNLTDMGTKRRV